MEIDKYKIYEIDGYRFVNFILLDEKTKEQVRIWRNSPEIRKFMYNTNEITPEEHLAFIDSLPQLNDRCYWLVYRDSEPIGVSSIVNIDYTLQSAESGYYLLPSMMDAGIGLEFIYSILHFFFKVIGCKNLFGRTEAHNINALILNRFFGAIPRQEIINLDGTDFIEQDTAASTFLELHKAAPEVKDFVRFSIQQKNIYKLYS